MDMEETHDDHQRQGQEQDSMGDLRLMRDFINMNSALPTSTTTHFPSFSLHPNFNFNNNINITAPFATSLSHSAPLNTHPPLPLTTPLEHSTDPSLNFPHTAPSDPSTARWPRQETLTLLHIRSRLHPNFKLANQKGPLWDQLSRIMWEEYGYQRSGKKCREKFENLYKYYKKTKEGKAGRQDGKHYRFFRQLEALCGENSNLSEPNFQSHQTNHDHSVSTELDTSSSELENIDYDWRRRWRKKIKEIIDSQMKEVMEKQEAWVERVMKRVEEKEKERVMREEEWSREEAARIEREHKFWAKERAWIEARDAALMDALQKLTAGINTELVKPQPLININPAAAAAEIIVQESWEDSEITTLLQMVESHEEAVWEEVATKMACFGYHKTASMCKHKWETITNYYANNRKDNSTRSFNYFHHNNTDLSNSLYNNQPTAYSNVNQPQHPHASSPPPNADTCFPFFMCPDTQNLWQNYGFNLNKPNQNP